MAERSYNGRVLNTNPTMTGTGSAASVANWIGDSSQGWGLGQTTSGAATGEYTSYLGEDCIKVVVTGLTQSGGTIGQIHLGNIGAYTAPSLSVGGLNTNPIYVVPLRSYTINLRYFIESTSASSGSVRLVTGVSWYNSNGTRISSQDSSSPDTTVSTDWETQTFNVTAPIKARYAIIKATARSNDDPTTDGAMTFYVSDLRCLEVLPARTPISTPRTTATNRVAVRDMGTALRFGAADTDRVVINNNANRVYDNISDMTLAFTFKANLFGDYYLFSIPATVGTNRKYVLLKSGRTINANIGAGGLGDIFSNAIENKWYTVMVMFDHTNSRAKAFVNGQESKAWTAVTYGTGNADISLCSISTTKALRGIADEFRMFPRILSDQEAADYYYNNAVPEEKLGEWLFNEATGSTAIDTSGNGNHGNISGATYTTDVPLKLRDEV